MGVARGTRRDRVWDVKGWPGWTFYVTPEPSDRSKARAVEVVAPAGESVTAEHWRKLPIGRVIRLAEGYRQGEELAAYADRHGIDVGEGRPYGSGVEFLDNVVALYRVALGHGLTPHKAIAELYQVTESTASAWFTEARRRMGPGGKPMLGLYDEEVRRYGPDAGLSEEEKQVRDAAIAFFADQRERKAEDDGE